MESTTINRGYLSKIVMMKLYQKGLKAIMKLLKKIIIIVSILLICTLIVFFFLNSKKEEKKPDNTNITIVEEENDISYDIKEGELDISDYNAVNSAIKVYLQKLNLNSMSYYGVGDDDDMVSIYSEDEKKQKIIDTLSKKYVADNSITTKNLTDYVETVDKELLFAPVEIKRIVPEGISEDEYASADMRTYIAKGIVVTSEYEFNRELYLIVNIDYVNRTFSLQPTEKKIQ